MCCLFIWAPEGGHHMNLFLISCFFIHSMWSRLLVRFFQGWRVKSSECSKTIQQFDAWQRQREKETKKRQTDMEKTTDVWEDGEERQKNRANSSMPEPRGDKWEQRALIRCSRRGYRLCSIDRYQPRVCFTSPPYLVTLLHPAPLSLRTGMSNEDTRLDGRRDGEEKKEGKKCNLCT